MRSPAARAAPAAVALAALLVALPAEAHGGASGAQEFLQHNLVALVLLGVIVAAAAALLWRNRPARSAAPAGARPGDTHSDPGPPATTDG